MMQRVSDDDALTRPVKPTSREIQILSEVANGYSAKEVGARLNISPRTVQTHVNNLCAKMGARNRTHLVAMALALGWVPADAVAFDPEPQ